MRLLQFSFDCKLSNGLQEEAEFDPPIAFRIGLHMAL